MKYFIQQAVPQTRFTKPSESTSVGGDGILFAFMLALVAGIFLFRKEKGEKGQKTKPAKLATGEYPRVAIDAHSEILTPNTQHTTSARNADFAQSSPPGSIPVADFAQSSPPGSIPVADFAQNSPPGSIPVADFALSDHPFSSDIAEVLKRVAREDGSSALCGDPGTGKSTITSEYIRQVQANCPGAEIQVLAIKNNDFCGLREQGRVSRFIGESAIEIAGVFFKQVDEEYQQRLELLSSDRSSLKPYVIILDDWLAIVAALNKTPITFDFGLILFNILTIGREYNMKFFVNLHSLNLAAIGIKEIDSNTRKILKLLILGNRYQKDGREIDAYGIIEQAIAGGQVVAHAVDKEKVRSQYSHFKEESRTKYQPIMFAFVGQYYVGLVPKFAISTNSPIHPRAESLNAIKELTATDALPEPLRTIWRYAKTQGDWVMIRDIVRKDYAVLKGKNTQYVIDCCVCLTEQGYGEVDLTMGKAKFKTR